MISVPEVIAPLITPAEGVELVTWDVVDEPPRPDIEIVVVPPVRAPFITRLAELPNLRGIILSTAGFDHVLRYLPPEVALTNAVGVHDSATAEMALTLMMAAQRDLPRIIRAQEKGQWLELEHRMALADQRVKFFF